MTKKTEPAAALCQSTTFAAKPLHNNSHAKTCDADTYGNAKEPKIYRTKAKAGDIADIPDRLPIITNRTYQNAMTFNKNDCAYIQPLSDTDNLNYKNGILYSKGFPATLAKLSTDENFSKFNLPLLWALYGIILNSIQQNRQNTDSVITIYYPDFAKKIGKSPNIGQNDVRECFININCFISVVGIINNGTHCKDILPVITELEYDAEKNTISFGSPYIVRIIQEIRTASIRKDKKGRPLLKKNGEPQMLPAYSYIIDMGIVKEKNKRAVEIVFIIIALIEQAGNNTPHIRAKTIVDRSPLLHKSLDGQSSSNKNILLKRAFEKAWELLRKKTFLGSVYNDIQLPDPEDRVFIPTCASLNKAIPFPHNGKRKDRNT